MQIAVLSHAVADVPGEAGGRADPQTEWLPWPRHTGPAARSQRTRRAGRARDQSGQPGGLEVAGHAQHRARGQPEPAPDHRCPARSRPALVRPGLLTPAVSAGRRADPASPASPPSAMTAACSERRTIMARRSPNTNADRPDSGAVAAV